MTSLSVFNSCWCLGFNSCFSWAVLILNNRPDLFGLDILTSSFSVFFRIIISLPFFACRSTVLSVDVGSVGERLDSEVFTVGVFRVGALKVGAFSRVGVFRAEVFTVSVVAVLGATGFVLLVIRTSAVWGTPRLRVGLFGW